MVICQTRGIAHCILLAKRSEVEEVAKNLGLTLPEGLQILDPQDPLIDKYVKPMVERRKGKLDELQAHEQLKDTVVLGTMMPHLGEVDGLVSAPCIPPPILSGLAFQLIKTAPQYSLVSSIFFMLLPEQVVVYGDCAINLHLAQSNLAEIALQSAQSAKAFEDLKTRKSHD
ncbi:MAG: phosphate acyltransferase [Moraxella sp.]